MSLISGFLRNSWFVSCEEFISRPPYCNNRRLVSRLLGPDYMSRAGPVSRAASVCRDDFVPGIT